MGRRLHTKRRYRGAVPSFCHLQFFEDWLCCVSSVFCVALFVLFCLLMMCLLEKIGEKRGAWLRLVLPASEFRWESIFQASFHSVVTLRMSNTRRLIRGYQICN